ncbi:MAG: hypothetical protein LBT50_02270 [Prevotellaceae bacterium]|jgi:hypothetical protein|nr:hypothetical protein [Prevotellaceae bacterium]
MKKVLFFLILALILSCKNESEKIFNGELIIVKNEPKMESLTGKHIEFDEIYTGQMFVYDSLIVFSSDKYGDYYSRVFNLNTGRQINSVIKIGQGPGEQVSVHCEAEYYVDTAINLWYYDGFHKKHGLLVNLKNNCIIDSIDFSGLPNDHQILTRFFILNDSLLLAWNQQKQLSGDNTAAPPLWSLFNYKTNEKLRQYDVFNDFKYYSTQFCLGSSDIIKTDKTKFAIIMNYLRQINIIDIKTGEIKGFRFKNSPDFTTVANAHYTDLKEYYIRACADDNFIYAAMPEGQNTVVDVFDWSGNYLKKLVFDKNIGESNIALDHVNKYLYLLTVGEEEEEAYQYDVSYLYK